MWFGQRMSISTPKWCTKEFHPHQSLLFPSPFKVKWLTSWLWHTIKLAKLWLQENWLRSSQELLHWIRLRTFYENDVLSNVCNCWNKEALGGVFPSLTKICSLILLTIMRIESSQLRTTKLIQMEYQVTAARQPSLYKWHIRLPLHNNQAYTNGISGYICTTTKLIQMEYRATCIFPTFEHLNFNS